MISVDQLEVSFGGTDLLKGISYLITGKDRIGLVGKNGAGKSTMLKILAGEQAPSSGTVTIPKDVRIGYLPQHMTVDNTQTVFEEARTAFREMLEMKAEIDFLNNELARRDDYESDGYMQLITRVTDLTDQYQIVGAGNFEAEIEQTLKGLGFERSDFSRPTSEFSGGWRMRIELAKILLRKPDVFLLDEPTNHLDIESIQWLEDFLSAYKGAVVLVSHDKAFLNNVTNRTIEISLGRIYDYKANYSRYLELREEHRLTQLAAYRNQQKLIEETEQFIERFRYKATKAVQVQSRAKMLGRMNRIEIEEDDNSKLNIKFPPAVRSGAVVVQCKQLSKSYDEHLILDQIDLTIERGEKVAFVGKNGEGKTTLARVILQELSYDGELKLGHNVKIGYFAQNQAQLLNGDLTVFETIDQIAVGDIRTRIRDILGAFMFPGEDVDKKVKVLSGGEKTRLAMIRLMLEPVNFLVMDEPTNHLDMRSKEMLKQALSEYDGTVLIVSHDREFLDGLANCVYEFKNKKVKQHLGGIYEFLREKKMESLRELEQRVPLVEKVVNRVVASEPVSGTEVSFDEKKKTSRELSKLKKQVQDAEDKISQCEKKIAEMNQQMNREGAVTRPLVFEEYAKCQKFLEEAMSKWEKLSYEYETLLKQKNW